MLKKKPNSSLLPKDLQFPSIVIRIQKELKKICLSYRSLVIPILMSNKKPRTEPFFLVMVSRLLLSLFSFICYYLGIFISF